MAFIIKDRVKEGTTSTGTGDVSLEGAIATFDTFQSYMANGDTTYYAIVHTSSGVDEWEVGLGTWNTGNTLTRTTVLAGSNGTSAENFSAGVKDVFMTYPASKAVYTDANGDIDINGGTIDGTTIGATAAATGKFTTLETTGNADIGGYIDLEVLSAHPAHREGRVFYDSIHKTLNFYSDDTHVVHELGIEEHQRVYNDTGSTILKGKPLYFSGNYTAGSIDVPTVGLADATDVNAYNAQGLAASDIPNNSYGYCIIAGQLDGFDTSGLTAGTNFFVGLTPGAVQNASPLYPNFPMCLGWVVNSDATDGTVLVNQQNHSVNSFRVRTSVHVGEDLQVDGNLTVLGSTTSVSTNDVTAGAPFYRANEGDAIGEAGTTFTGTGLDDAFFAGHFTGTTPTTYYVKIDGVGTGTGGVDTFAWSTDNFVTSVATGVDITGNEQLIHSADNISVTFSSTTGHTLNDQWNGTASPINVDSGFFTNYNTGTSGVGYTHTGFYYDASEGKWVLLSEYDPVPAGAIDLSDSSVSYAALKAGSFEGNLTGSVTGNVTGTATSATALATARTIGGVSFNGTANIDLPGVNTTGNQDTTGNAATATALETSRTIQLTGDVTGSASFDGSANISITAAVQDDSHNHVISNVDGLQTVLDGKTTTARTISAGSGLTGGGDLTANRTLNVGAGTGVTVNADTVAIGQDVGTTSDVTFNDIRADGGNLILGEDALSSSSLFVGMKTSFQSGADDYMIISGTSDGNTYVSAKDGNDVHIRGGGNASTYEIKVYPDAYATAAGSTIITEAGSGLSKSSRTLSHADTSSQASVNNSNGTVIQDITLDTYGHITGLASANLDDRYVQDSGTTFNGTYPVVVRTAQNDIYSHPSITFTGSTNTLAVGGNITVSGNSVFHDGYHPNADKWTTARTLSLSGDASGSVSWDGSANATLSVAVANDSHTHDGRYYTESEADSRFVNVTGDTMTAPLTIDTNTDSMLRLSATNAGPWAIELDRDDATASKVYNGGGFWYFQHRPKFANNLAFDDGYHPNADKWTTARTLSLSGDASGSVSWDGSGNASISVTVNNIDGNTFVNSDSGNAVNADTIAANGISYYTAGVTNFSGNATDGALYSQKYSSTWQHQIAGDYRSGQIAVRGKNSGTWQPWYKVWSENNDGSGSGLDADLLDGVQGSSYLRSDAADSKSGNLNLTSGTQLLVGGEFSHNAYSTNASSTIYLGGGNDRQNYSIGTELHNYGGNYTKLDLRWHTGIRVFARTQYGGVRYFSDSAMNNLIFSVGETDGNVRVTNTIYAGAFSGDGSNLTGIDAGAPAGSIIYHAGSSAPSGYVKANGASLSTSTYSALFSAIGYTYGGSGGSFNVPDLRGEFIRGWDDGRGVDSGRGFGSFQSDDFGSHSHTAYGGFSSTWFSVYARSGSWGSERFMTTNSYQTASTGAADTRPRNRAMLACIKI